LGGGGGGGGGAVLAAATVMAEFASLLLASLSFAELTFAFTV